MRPRRNLRLGQVMLAELPAWAEVDSVCYYFDGTFLWAEENGDRRPVEICDVPLQHWHHENGCTCRLCSS